MTAGKEDLIRYKLSWAKETPEEAEIMLQTSHSHGATNRIYYACFYVVTALLLKRGKHSGVVGLFNRHFVKPGLVGVDMGKFYSRMFDNRLESDYADWVEMGNRDIQEELILAKEFIGAITDLLNKQ